jgi:hypothetical protein
LFELFVLFGCSQAAEAVEWLCSATVAKPAGESAYTCLLDHRGKVYRGSIQQSPLCLHQQSCKVQVTFVLCWCMCSAVQCSPLCALLWRQQCWDSPPTDKHP